MVKPLLIENTSNLTSLITVTDSDGRDGYVQTRPALPRGSTQASSATYDMANQLKSLYEWRERSFTTCTTVRDGTLLY